MSAVERRVPREARSRRRARRGRGASMLEALVALPVLLFMGLALLQLALLGHARDALQLAVLEGARAGSVAGAERSAIERGLARGLVPLLAAGSGSDDAERQLAHATSRLDDGLRGGWIRWRQLSPTRESFVDWGRAAGGADSAARVGVEIPIDHLATEALVRRPSSGASGDRAGAPIGAASGQTLTDAALLRLELAYGAPAVVPLAGRLIAFTLAEIDGCRLPRIERLGAVALGRPEPGPAPRDWACAVYAGGADDGRPRIPIRASALVRMQSNPRLTEATPTRASLAAGRLAAGPGLP